MVTSLTLVRKETLLGLLQEYVRQEDLPPGSLSQRLDAFTPTNGQTVFNLAEIASQPQLSILALNGAKARYGVDYSINSAVLTWLSPLVLDSRDAIEILYYF